MITLQPRSLLIGTLFALFKLNHLRLLRRWTVTVSHWRTCSIIKIDYIIKHKLYIEYAMFSFHPGTFHKHIMRNHHHVMQKHLDWTISETTDMAGMMITLAHRQADVKTFGQLWLTYGEKYITAADYYLIRKQLTITEEKFPKVLNK